MQIKNLIIIAYLLKCLLLLPLNSENNSHFDINKIAFGGTYNNYELNSKDIFNTINSLSPDMFIWLGHTSDIDSTKWLGVSSSYNKSEMIRRYNNTYNSKNYKQLREKIPVLGIWDNNDFKYNNKEGILSNKEELKEAYLNFLDEPQNSKRRKEGDPINSSYSFGKGFKTFKVILPDLKFEKSAESVMSEKQWEWLDNEFLSNETFTFIGTDIQFLPFDRNAFYDAWSSKDRERLVNLIHKHKKSGVIFISSDIYCGQLLRTFCVHPSKLYYK